MALKPSKPASGTPLHVRQQRVWEVYTQLRDTWRTIVYFSGKCSPSLYSICVMADFPTLASPASTGARHNKSAHQTAYETAWSEEKKGPWCRARRAPHCGPWYHGCDRLAPLSPRIHPPPPTPVRALDSKKEEGGGGGSALVPQLVIGASVSGCYCMGAAARAACRDIQTRMVSPMAGRVASCRAAASRPPPAVHTLLRKSASMQLASKHTKQASLAVAGRAAGTMASDGALLAGTYQQSGSWTEAAP